MSIQKGSSAPLNYDVLGAFTEKLKQISQVDRKLQHVSQQYFEAAAAVKEDAEVALEEIGFTLLDETGLGEEANLTTAPHPFSSTIASCNTLRDLVITVTSAVASLDQTDLAPATLQKMENLLEQEALHRLKTTIKERVSALTLATPSPREVASEELLLAKASAFETSQEAITIGARELLDLQEKLAGCEDLGQLLDCLCHHEISRGPHAARALGFESLARIFRSALLRRQLEVVPLELHFPKLQLAKAISPTTPPEQYEGPSGRELIGTQEAPGTLIATLNSYRESYLMRREDGQEKDQELLEQSQEQAEALGRLISILQEQPKLVLFSDDPHQRVSEYEELAQMLAQAIARHGEVLFVPGPNSICELPSVCYPGWKMRLESFLREEGNASIFSRTADDERRKIFNYETIPAILADRHLWGDDIHLPAAIERRYAAQFGLEVTTSIDEPLIQELIGVVDLGPFQKKMSASFLERYLPITQEIFKEMEAQQQEALLERVSQLYRRACLQSQQAWIDPCEMSKELYVEFDQLLQRADRTPEEVVSALSELRKKFDEAALLFPSIKLPERFETLVAASKRSHRQMQGYHPRWGLNSKNEFLRFAERYKVEVKGEDKAYLEGGWSQEDCDEILQALRAQNLTKHQMKQSVEENVAQFSHLLVDENREGTRELTDFGAVLVAMVENQQLFPSEQKLKRGSSQEKPVQVLGSIAQEAFGYWMETLPPITDRAAAIEFFKNHPDLTLEAIRNRLDPLLLQDEEVLLAAVQSDYRALAHADPALHARPFYDQCLKRARENDLLSLYRLMVNKLPQDLPLALLVLRRCPSYQAPAVLEIARGNMPEKQESLEKAAIRKNRLCELLVPHDETKRLEIIQEVVSEAQDQLPMLLRDLPGELLKKDLIDCALVACNPLYVPGVFNHLPEPMRQKESVQTLALSQCERVAVLHLFGKLPSEGKANPAVAQSALCRCARYDIPEVINHIVTASSSGVSDALAKTALSRCYPKQVKELFELLPRANQEMKEIQKTAIQICHGNDLMSLCRHPVVRFDEELARTAFQHCYPEQVPEILHRILLKDEQVGLAMIEQAAVHCDPKDVSKIAFIKELFAPKPHLKVDEGMSREEASDALKKCSAHEVHLLLHKILVKNEQLVQAGLLDHIFEGRDWEAISDIYSAGILFFDPGLPRGEYARKALEACNPTKVVDLFQHFGRIVVDHEELINASFEKCTPSQVEALMQAVADLGYSESEIYEIAKISTKPECQWGESYIRGALKFFPKEHVLEIFENIFKGSIEEEIQDQLITLACIQSNPTDVGEILRRSPQSEEKKDLVLWQVLAERNSHDISVMFIGLPPEHRKDELITRALERCAPGDVADLVSCVAFGRRTELSDELVKLALLRCDDVVQVFDALPLANRLQKESRRLALANCSPNRLLELCGNYTIQFDQELADLALKQCGDLEVYKLMTLFSQRGRSDEELYELVKATRGGVLAHVHCLLYWITKNADYYSKID